MPSHRVFLTAILSIAAAGCSPGSNPELAKAKAEADAARAEAVALKSELDKAKAELAYARDKRDANEHAKELDRNLKLARTIAEGAMNAVMKANTEELKGFCTPEERNRATTIIVRGGNLNWAIDSEVMGGSGREATFKGHIDWAGGKSQFVILVIPFNDGDQDRWLVDAISISN